MRRGSAIFAGKVLVAAAVLALVYHHVSLDDVTLDVRRLDVTPLLGFFAILFVSTFVSALKWKWILEVDGIRQSLLHLYGSYLIGTFLNLFMPSMVGGDTYRVASVGRGRVAKSSAAVIADRLSGLIALAVICALFSVVTYSSIGRHNYMIFAVLLLCALLGLASALLWPAYSRRLLTALGLRRIPRLDRFVDRLFVSFRSYREHPTLIGRIIGISFLFQFLISVAVFLLTRSLALRVPLVDFLVFVPIITILESIPISIYGLGLRDAGYVFFFKEIDLPGAETHALAMSILYVVLPVNSSSRPAASVANAVGSCELPSLCPRRRRGRASNAVGSCELLAPAAAPPRQTLSGLASSPPSAPAAAAVRQTLSGPVNSSPRPPRPRVKRCRVL